MAENYGSISGESAQPGDPAATTQPVFEGQFRLSNIVLVGNPTTASSSGSQRRMTGGWEARWARARCSNHLEPLVNFVARPSLADG